MAIKDYSTEPDMNTTISGINIAEGCPPSGINNAIRQLMADVKAESEAQSAKDAEQDEAISAAQSSADDKLPLIGGHLFGSVVFDQEDAVIYKNSDTGRMIIRGGTSGYENGGALYLYGKNNADRPGGFHFSAHDASTSCAFIGMPDKTLTWGGVRHSAFCMPGTSYTNLTLSATNTTYTAPDDGYVYIRGSLTSTGWVELYSSSSGSYNAVGVTLQGDNRSCSGYIPVRKGQSFKVLYEGFTVTTFRFTPCKGAE